jgi:hypothetical protein
MHVRGYKEKGNINTPMELAINNQIDRYSLVIDAIDRTPELQRIGAAAKERCRDLQTECRNYAYEHGIDKPEVVNWRWPYLGDKRGDDQLSMECGDWDRGSRPRDFQQARLRHAGGRPRPGVALHTEPVGEETPWPLTRFNPKPSIVRLSKRVEAHPWVALRHGRTVLFAVVRGIASAEPRLLLVQFLLLAAAASFEVVMLTIVRRAIRLEREVHRSLWLLMVFVESTLPTIAIFMQTESSYTTPYKSLVAPVILVYFILIILSTLRLAPHLCWLMGLLSAIGYGVATVYTYQRYPSAEFRSDALPLAFYIVYALLMLLGGIVAGFVAGQIRSHVSAALREADLQRELERVTTTSSSPARYNRDCCLSNRPSLRTTKLPAGINPPTRPG